MECLNFWSTYIMWYLAPLPTFEERKKEDPRWQTEVTQMLWSTVTVNSPVQLCGQGFL